VKTRSFFMLFKPLTLAALIAISHSAAAAPYTINVSGTFHMNSEELDNPSNPNSLAFLDGLSFTGSFTLDNAPSSLNPDQYTKEINNDDNEVTYWFHGANYYNVTMSIPDASGMSWVGPGSGAGVENEFYYDGSQGFVPAGTYDNVGFFGWAPGMTCTNCINDIDWSEGTPLTSGYTFGLTLFGYANMLQGQDNLGIDENLANVLIGEMYLEQYESGIVIGAVGTFGAVSGSLNALSVTPVPEPETYALMLVGLGLVGFAARRRKKA
jgi:hypothetical protein